MSVEMGHRLKKLRTDCNFTQKEVGDFLGISQSLLAKVESGDRNLNLTKLLKLCDLYNVSEEFILYGNEFYDKNKIAFRKDNKKIKLETIAKMNRIINNLKFMEEINRNG